jgi:hypothetical protein
MAENRVSVGDAIELIKLVLVVGILLGIYRAITSPLEAFDTIRDFWRWLLFGPTTGDGEHFGPTGDPIGTPGGSSSGTVQDPMLERARSICGSRGGVKYAVTGELGNPFASCNDGSEWDLLSGRQY